MKRFLTLAASLLLFAALIVSVFAAETITVGIKASKTTANPGETVTVTVSVSDFKDCIGGSLKISYNTDVFERSSNSWTLATTPIMGVPDGDAVFAYGKNNATAVSGNIYQFTLKVKDNAPRGNYEVKVSVELNGANGSASGSKKVSITVDCNHTYDNSCDVDCNICGSKRTAEHIFDKGKITKEATCTEAGEKLLTCTVCKATKTEATQKAEHTYDNSCDTKCNVCDAERTIKHSWDKGKVTKEANCTQKGEKLFTCKVCKETKTESVKKTSHSYDNDCDPSCNSCGTERKVEHSYAKTWSVDETTHWYACSICGEKKDAGEHVFATEWTVIDVGHGYACTVCGAIPGVQPHEFDNACDEDCNICGHQREITHDYSKKWSYDADGHWQVCTVCGDELEMIPHTPGAEATETSDQICTDCGFIITPAGNHEHSMAGDWLSDETSHWYLCACGVYVDAVNHTWDAGMIDLEKMQILYHCTACGYLRTEEYIPPTTPPETQPSESTEPSVPPTTGAPTEAPTEPNLTPVQESEAFPFWIVLAIFLGISVVLNIVLLMCLISKSKEGKYSKHSE